MPVLSNDSVNVTPLTSRTTMTLDEIREKLAHLPPQLATHTGGWASTNNAESNMGFADVAPPISEPEPLEADGYLPRMIRKRYYY
ncbi:hypothetical protein [Microbacterium sp.]|uniref:hypothetical protein n=1 Tax=Microbacterium sp. TaxID=51671 RepID=UPI0026071190|nr:hypothetical protein [Microbacterium sp.]